MISETTILFQIAGIGIIVALMQSILNQMGKEEIGQFVTLAGFIIVLLLVIHRLADFFQKIKTVFLMQ